MARADAAVLPSLTRLSIGTNVVRCPSAVGAVVPARYGAESRELDDAYRLRVIDELDAMLGSLRDLTKDFTEIVLQKALRAFTAGVKRTRNPERAHRNRVRLALIDAHVYIAHRTEGFFAAPSMMRLFRTLQGEGRNAYERFAIVVLRLARRILTEHRIGTLTPRDVTDLRTDAAKAARTAPTCSQRRRNVLVAPTCSSEGRRARKFCRSC